MSFTFPIEFHYQYQVLPRKVDTKHFPWNIILHLGIFLKQSVIQSKIAFVITI
jgi:hypothetical protein